jgi:hypothetical protein
MKIKNAKWRGGSRGTGCTKGWQRVEDELMVVGWWAGGLAGCLGWWGREGPFNLSLLLLGCGPSLNGSRHRPLVSSFLFHPTHHTSHITDHRSQMLSSTIAPRVSHLWSSLKWSQRPRRQHLIALPTACECHVLPVATLLPPRLACPLLSQSSSLPSIGFIFVHLSFPASIQVYCSACCRSTGHLLPSSSFEPW